MMFFTTVCPRCGALVDGNDEEETAVCRKCGTRFEKL